MEASYASRQHIFKNKSHIIIILLETSLIALTLAHIFLSGSPGFLYRPDD
jgi:hypothetical protein